jgi:hypothetical protein
VQLIGSQYPIGVVGFDQSYGAMDGCGSLVLECADCAEGGVGNNWAAATAIKRMWRGSNTQIPGVVEMEWVWYFASQYDQNSPRHVVFGLDCASPTGTPRQFFQVRWLNYDVVSLERLTKYQVLDVDGVTWRDVPGAAWQTGATGDAAGTVYPHGWNENKRDWHHLRARFDVASGKYDGIMIDGDPFGSYADTASKTALRAFGPKQETLHTFENGFNGYFSIENNSASPVNTHGWAGLGYFRAETGWTL